ncbi:MAG: serine/threonine protein kinase [Akkermansia sp.]|nr:serine/threonine protein kinase [Akkermansia sp.]
MMKPYSGSVPLPRGTRLDKYELLGVLGQGGGGICYLAVDRQMGREVVIKEHFPREICQRVSGAAEVVATEEQAYAQSLHSFCRGARILAALNHDGIVQIHEIFSACGTAYGVMALVEGQSLRAWMEQKPAPTRVVNLLKSLLGTLLYLHTAGVIHRDIKPSNIIVRADDHPVLIDFDSAMMAEPTHVPTPVGTPGYAAPEQFCEGTLPVPASDLYALGRTLSRVTEEYGIILPSRIKRSLQKACAEDIAARFYGAEAWSLSLAVSHGKWWWGVGGACLVFICTFGLLHEEPVAASASVEKQPLLPSPPKGRYPFDLVMIDNGMSLVAGAIEPSSLMEIEFQQAVLAAQQEVDAACDSMRKNEVAQGRMTEYQLYATRVGLEEELNRKVRTLVEAYIATAFNGKDPQPKRTNALLEILEKRKIAWLKSMAKEYPCHPYYLVQYNRRGEFVYPSEYKLTQPEEKLVSDLLRLQEEMKKRSATCATEKERYALRLALNEQAATLIDAYQSRYFDEYYMWLEYNLATIKNVLSKGVPKGYAAHLLNAESLAQKYPSVTMQPAYRFNEPMVQGEDAGE